jgi:hypothetical protein
VPALDTEIPTAIRKYGYGAAQKSRRSGRALATQQAPKNFACNLPEAILDLARWGISRSDANLGDCDMSFDRVGILAVVLSAALLLANCGTYVPGVGEIYDREDPTNLVDAIIGHVQCELQNQIQFIILDDMDLASTLDQSTGKPRGRQLAWLDRWAAQTTLTLTVDEKTTLSPGVTYNKVLSNAVAVFPNGNVTTGQSFNLGIGATASSDGTQKATIAWETDFKKITSKKSLAQARIVRDKLYQTARDANTSEIPSICTNQNGILIEGDLRLRDWLYMALRPAFVKGGVIGDYADALKDEARTSKKDVLQDQITFAVQYSGNVTPSWKLMQVSANSTGSLFGAQRSRTEDLLITLGPSNGDGTLQTKAQNEALASAIGIAVANAIQSRQP